MRKNIKNLNLVICRSTGNVRITVPNKIKDDAIRDFVTSKLPLIKKHKTKFETQTQLSEHAYISGEC